MLQFSFKFHFSLQEENDSLRCQLEAYKNEVEIIRSDLKLELQAKDQHIKSLDDDVKALKEKLKSQPDQSPTVESTSVSVDDRSSKLLSIIQLSLIFYIHSILKKSFIGLVTVCLSVQHLGASLDDVFNFVRKSDSSYTKEETETIPSLTY